MGSLPGEETVCILEELLTLREGVTVERWEVWGLWANVGGKGSPHCCVASCWS